MLKQTQDFPNLKKQGPGIFLFSMLSSRSRAPESMNIIAEVEEGGGGGDIAYIAYTLLLLLLHLRTTTLGTSCAMDMGPWKDRLGEYIVSVMCVKRKRETGKRRKMHEGRNYASPITQRERWDLGTSIHIGSNVVPS